MNANTHTIENLQSAAQAATQARQCLLADAAAGKNIDPRQLAAADNDYREALALLNAAKELNGAIDAEKERQANQAEIDTLFSRRDQLMADYQQANIQLAEKAERFNALLAETKAALDEYLRAAAARATAHSKAAIHDASLAGIARVNPVFAEVDKKNWPVTSVLQLADTPSYILEFGLRTATSFIHPLRGLPVIGK